MAVGNDKRQVSITLPIEVLDKLDKLAEYELRPRSQLIGKIIVDYLKTVDFSKIEE